VHGQSDPLVPVATMESYRDALIAAGREASAVVVPQAGHEWLAQAVTAIPAWFDAHWAFDDCALIARRPRDDRAVIARRPRTASSTSRTDCSTTAHCQLDIAHCQLDIAHCLDIAH